MKPKRILAMLLSFAIILSLVPLNIAFADETQGENDIGIVATDETSQPYTIESVKAMIDALPDASELEAMNNDELSEVYDKAQDAYDAFETLTDEEQIELSNGLEKLVDVLDFMTTKVTPLTTVAETLKDGDRINSITYSDGVSQYFTYNNRLYKITYTNLKTDTNACKWVYLEIIKETGYCCLRVRTSGMAYPLYHVLGETIKTSDIPTTPGERIECCRSGPIPAATITCLELTANPTWSWDTDGLNATAIFTAAHYDVCAKVKASVTTNITENDGGIHTKNSVATASFGGKMYTDTLQVTTACSYNSDGICSVCGGYQPAKTTGENCYEIMKLGQLMWFAQKVNAGEIKNHSVVLKGNIVIDNEVVWTPISLTDHCESTFDGQGWAITFANTREGSTFGLFGSYNYSTIKNLTLAGSINCNQSSDTGALVNRAYSTTIQNVMSICTVNNSGTGNTGGLAGYFGGGSATIKNSAVYADVTGGGDAGGLISNIWNGNQPCSVYNSAYMGSVSGAQNAGALVGYNGNNSSKSSLFTDVYYCEKNGLGYLGATFGGKISATRVETKTAEQFRSGEVAYLLNNGVTDGTQAWYQFCKYEDYPRVPFRTDNRSDVVYRGYVCGIGSSTPVYANSMDGLIANPRLSHNYNNEGFCEYCGEGKPADYNGTERAYEIYSPGQLKWFADKVNKGNTTINGKLMKDINASSIANLGVGTNSAKYAGTFDGNGYGLTIAIDSTTQYAAPFQYVNGATIKNLTVKGPINTNQKFAASIVGLSEGTTNIEKCMSYVTINSTVDGDGTHGGLVANVGNGTATITSCGFAGAINGSNTTSCGGLVGWSGGTTNITNSFVAATFGVKADESDTFARNQSTVTVTDCYYLKALGEEMYSGATQATADQFASGEVAYLLNGSKSNGIWKQTLKTDKTPNFGGGAVYLTTPCVSYSNSALKEHDYDNLNKCTACGHLKSDENGYYEIENVAQLFYFAQLVNGGEYGFNAKLMADLDLTGQTWTPIAYLAMSASPSVGYTGTFDGNGHVISNIEVITPTSATANGLFGIVTTGTVKNLGIDNLTFDNDDADHRAGGIAGQLMSGGTIENCFVVNSTIKSAVRVVGGIVGLCKGTVKNCYTANLTLAAYKNRFGGITGDYEGGSIVNCYTDYTALGSTNDSVGTKDALSQTNISKDDFGSGRITWLLNDNSSDGVWKQTIGTDGYPNFKGTTVYRTAPCLTYTNTNTEKQHNYGENGVCQDCGDIMREEAVLNESENLYEISNLNQLLWFADKVNGGETAVNAKLTANIDLSSIADFGMGTSSAKYAGTFDGNGYTLNINLNGTENVALFPYVNGATIRNLAVTGYISASCGYAGSFVGQSEGNVTIEKCISYVTINSTVDGDGTHGGLLGVENSGTLTINYCGFAGAINGSKTHSCGGLVGWSGGTTNISNSFVAATFGVKSDKGNTFSRGNNVTVTNCYYLNKLNGVPSGATQKNSAQFASGEVAYMLNGSQSNGVWKQALKTDATPNFSGGAVYLTTPCVSYSNNELKEHNYDNVNYCADCKKLKLDEDGYYEIDTVEKLLYFAQRVNAGEYTFKAKLTADIDATSVSYIGIGKDKDHAFAGTFDGNNKTLKIALVSTEQYVAPFIYVNGATIKNLTVSGTVKTTHKFAAGIVGRTEGGNAKLENCLSLVEIDSTDYTDGNKNDGTHGGLIAVSGEGSTITINNCGFAGSIIGENTTSCGGIVGWAGSTVSISNSFVAANFKLKNNSGDTFARNQKYVTVTNCYYLNALSDAMYSGATQATADQFASGEVAYQLQGTQETQIWGQTIGTDTYPKFSDAKVYEDTYNSEKIYRNEIDTNKILLLGADKKSATVVLDKAGTYTIVFADYEGNQLANLKTFEVTVDKKQAVRVVSDQDFTLDTGDKIMLWDNFVNLKPMCDAYEIK